MARVTIAGLVAAGLCVSVIAIAGDRRIGVELRRETFDDVRGGAYRLPAAHDCKATAVVFVGHDCPISNGYAKEIGRIVADFGPKKVAFCIVYADADVDKDAARKHAEEFGYTCPAVLDPRMILAAGLGATIKPEVAVISAKGDVVYRGRIDNRYVDFGVRRNEVTKRDLRDALEAVIANKAVPTPRTQAIGCDIDFTAKVK